MSELKKGLQDTIVDALRRRILGEYLQAGERLPPERELAKQFGTNRNTLREAIRRLESEGLVSVRQGQGVTVRSYREEGQLQLLPYFLESGPDLAERVRALEDVLHIRRVFMSQAVSFAAERAGSSIGPELKRLVRQIIEAAQDGDLEGVMELDLALYRTVARGTGSLAMVWAFNTFDAQFRDGMRQIAHLWLGSEVYLSGLVEVVDRIQAADSQGARLALLEHFDRSDREVLRQIDILLGSGEGLAHHDEEKR